MKTSALKARITSFSRRGAEGKRCARPPHRTASLAIFICSLFRYRRLFIARNRDTRRENIALPTEGRRRRERKGERGEQRGRKENLSAFSVFAIFANVSFVMDHQGRSTMCIVRRIVLMYQRFASPSTASKRTSLFCVTLFLFLSSFAALVAEAASILSSRQVQNHSPCFLRVNINLIPRNDLKRPCRRVFRVETRDTSRLMQAGDSFRSRCNFFGISFLRFIFPLCCRFTFDAL